MFISQLAHKQEEATFRFISENCLLATEPFRPIPQKLYSVVCSVELVEQSSVHGYRFGIKYFGHEALKYNTIIPNADADAHSVVIFNFPITLPCGA